MKTLNSPPPAVPAKTGQVFQCVKNNRLYGLIKGRFYLYDHGLLMNYTTRTVTVFADGDEVLALPGVFETARRCPFCGASLTASPSATAQTAHDAVECAQEWDARVKGYER